MTHPSVAEAACVAAPDPVMGEEVCAFVIPSGDREPDARRRCARISLEHGLARFKLPARLEVRDRAAAHRERQGAEGAAARRAARVEDVVNATTTSPRGFVRSSRRGSRPGRSTGPSRCSAPATTTSKPAAAYLGALAGTGLAVPSWPREYGGLGATPAEVAVVRARARRLRRPRPVPLPRRPRAHRADAARARHARAVRALAAGDRDRRGDLVPALLGAGRRLRPRGPRRRARTPRVTSGACTARRCGRAAARTRAGGCCSPATIPTVPKHRGHHRVRRRHARRRASTCGRCAR